MEQKWKSTAIKAFFGLDLTHLGLERKINPGRGVI